MAIAKKRFIKTLTDWGLSPNEALVYLSAVALGRTSVMAIARDSGVTRTNVYAVMESLQKKGLLSIEVRGLKKYYMAESPAALKQIIENKKQEFEELLPSLLGMYNTGSSGEAIKYFEGVANARQAYDLLLSDLRPGDEYLVISNDEEWYSLDQKYFDKFIERRAKMKLDIRLLLQDTPEGRRFKKYEKNFAMSVRLLPENTDLSTTLIITPKRVVIQQLSFPIIALIIENRSIIKMHRECFNIMWNAIQE